MRRRKRTRMSWTYSSKAVGHLIRRHTPCYRHVPVTKCETGSKLSARHEVSVHAFMTALMNIYVHGRFLRRRKHFLELPDLREDAYVRMPTFSLIRITRSTRPIQQMVIDTLDYRLNEQTQIADTNECEERFKQNTTYPGTSRSRHPPLSKARHKLLEDSPLENDGETANGDEGSGLHNQVSISVYSEL